MMDSILNLAAKRGRVVVTNIHPFNETEVTMNLMLLTIYEKQVVGSIFGSANIHSDIPKLLKLYRNGLLDLDSMITNTYKLGDINQGYQDMRDGKNIRGVLIYDELTARLTRGAGARLCRRAVRGPDVVAALADLFGHHADAHEDARRPCNRGRGRRPTPAARRRRAGRGRPRPPSSSPGR